MITISAFSDWKCGALTDEQFYSLTARENRRDRDLYEESLSDYKGTCLNCGADMRNKSLCDTCKHMFTCERSDVGISCATHSVCYGYAPVKNEERGEEE